MEELGGILGLPIYGPGRFRTNFWCSNFWGDITCLSAYEAVKANSSWIKNPSIRYAQKALAYTTFGRRGSHGVETQRELFFLYAMLHCEVVNVAAFIANFLAKWVVLLLGEFMWVVLSLKLQSILDIRKCWMLT